MINKGKEFESRIKALKKLAALRKKNYAKYEKDYIIARDNMAKDYDVTVRAVQIWIVQRTPWIRDKRDDAGKERRKAPRRVSKMINELIDNGMTKKKVKAIVQDKSGQKVSDRMLNREAKKEISKEETAFGDPAKEYFRKLFEMDLIPPDKGLKMKFKNTNFIITKSDLEDVCRILSNAYNRYADSKNKMNINRAAFRKSKLWQMYDEAVNIINHRGINITDLKEISLFIQRLEIDRNKINPRVQTFYKIIQTFNPDVTLDEVISLAEEYEGVYD